MYVKSLAAWQFRNIQSEEIRLEKGVNVLYGKNASGKTNALEALYLFASGKSLRGSAERDFIRHGAEYARIHLTYVSERSPDAERRMSMTFMKGNRKALRCDGAEVARLSEFLGRFRSCVFTPDDLALVKGSPDERRRFMDSSLCQIRPRFVRCLNDYARLLAQKNNVLKNAKVTGSFDKTYMDVLNEQLAAAAGVIVRQRSAFCERLYEQAKPIYREISGGSETLGLKYVSQTKKNYADEAYTSAAYRRLFENALETEVRNGVALTGPHRDDVLFSIGKDSDLEKELQAAEKEADLSAPTYAAKSFGSRGQQRSVVLALKLAQGELFYALCGEYPVFLLDDVFSELDARRRDTILSHMRDKQVVITCCDGDVLQSVGKYHGIYVENGTYRSVE